MFFGVLEKKLFKRLAVLQERVSSFINTGAGELVFLITILSIYIVNCFASISKFAFWADEAFSAYMIQFDYIKIVQLTALDVHPPFYYWTLKTWAFFFGNSETSLRSMSVFFGCLSIVAAYYLIKYIFNKKQARFISVVLLFAPLMLRYSQEVRMYTMMIFVALLSTLVFVVADRKRTKDFYWILYGIISGLGILVHYMFGLTILSQWLWRLYITRKSSGSLKFFESGFIRSIRWMFAVVLIWLPVFFSQFFLIQSRGFWPSVISFKDVIELFSTTLLYIPLGDLGWLMWIGLCLAVVCFYWLCVNYARLTTRRSKYSSLILTVCFFPIALLILLSLPPFKPVFITRYLIVSSFFMYILVGLSVSVLIKKNKLSYLAGFIVFASMFVGSYSVNNMVFHNDPDARNSNIRDLAGDIKNSGVEAPIITNSYGIFYETNYYMKDISENYFVSTKRDRLFGAYNPVRDSDHELYGVDEIKGRFKQFWYVVQITNGDSALDRSPRPNIEWQPQITLKRINRETNEPGFCATLFTWEDL